MIRPRQPLPLYGSGNIYLPEVRILENGSTEIHLTDQSESNLPDSSKTRLSDVLKSGVLLNEVNPHVLGIQQVTLSMDKKETSNEGEE